MPTKVDGIDYTPEGIRELRNVIIADRDAALDSMNPDFAEVVKLTHVVALLAYLADIEEEGTR